MTKINETEAAPCAAIDHSGRWIALGAVVFFALVAAVLVMLRQMGVK
jgi:hypothetical protein